MPDEAHAAPSAQVAHVTHGRVRIQIPDRRHDMGYFAALESGLRDAPEVHRVEVRPHTGSVIVQHEGDLHDLGEFARRRGLFVLKRFEPPEDSLREAPVADWVMREVAGLDHRVQHLTRGKLDAGTAVFLLLAGLALMQAVRGRALPPAMTLLWEAANALMLERAVRARRAGAPPPPVPPAG